MIKLSFISVYLRKKPLQDFIFRMMIMVIVLNIINNALLNFKNLI